MALPLVASDEPDRYPIQLYHRTAAQADLGGKRVLEVSCGHGGGAAYLTRTLQPASYTGVDLNPTGVELLPRATRCAGPGFRSGQRREASVHRRILRRGNQCGSLTLLRSFSPISSPKWHACCAREGIFCTPISAAGRASPIGRRRLPTHRYGCSRGSTSTSRLSEGWGTIHSGCSTSSVAAFQSLGSCTV